MLQKLGEGRRFSELHDGLATGTPRALALALQEPERSRRVQLALRGEDDLDPGAAV